MREWIERACGMPDVVFGLVLTACLVGGGGAFFNDPGTAWHVELGRTILETGCVPRVDQLTFTRVGAPWVDQSWLFDAGLALVVERAGWSGAFLLVAWGLAALYEQVARGLIQDGVSTIAAACTALIAFGIGSIHFLVRPHLFTFVFFYAALRLCRRTHERGGWSVFWVVPMTALWANLHGGFLAGPLVVFTAAVGHLLAGPIDRARLWTSSIFLVAGACALAAALVNPYGFGLYKHVFALLVSSGVTSMIIEYQPMPFGTPDARVMEGVILALVALPAFKVARLDRFDLVQSLVWLHFSLTQVRQAPLFAFAVAPLLARSLDALPIAFRDVLGTRRWSLWPASAAAALVVALLTGSRLGGHDPEKWPLRALSALGAAPAEARLFHEQDWGGLLELAAVPKRPAYIDDRFELFGKPFLVQYLNALEGGPDWDAIRDLHAISLVWIKPNRMLARRLEFDPGWVALYRDDVSVLYARRDTSPSEQPPAVPATAPSRESPLHARSFADNTDAR